MTEREGVVKYQLAFTPAEPLPYDSVRELNAWRRLLYLTGLVGRDPARYGGVGFGNISQRVLGRDHFVITGSQTGTLPTLSAAHFTTVLACHPDENRIVAAGPIRPSSESMTHGTVYALDDSVRWVLHGHSPHIWRHAAALNIPATHPDVEYGTPAMAAEVRRLFRDTNVRAQGIFVMAGHEDGVVAFGHTAASAGSVLLTYLARAFSRE